MHYSSSRLWPGTYGAGGTINAELRDLIGALDKELPVGQAAPATLEHFLVERYILYSQSPAGKVWQGQVHHRPYPLQEAVVRKIDQTFVSEIGVTTSERPDHVLFSEGVDVEIFGLQPA